eukprot:gene4567-19472_t
MGGCSSRQESGEGVAYRDDLARAKLTPVNRDAKVSTWSPSDFAQAHRITHSSAKASKALQAMVREHGQSISIHDVYSGMPKAGTHRAHALGEGACGKVYKIKNITTGKEFACKSIKMKSGSNPEKERKQLMEEITLIKMLDHPNTIKVIEVFQTPRELQIVMEMCTGGELFDRLYEQPSNKFSEHNCKRLFRQMLKSLAYIHANNIFHRDIKLENFLFTDKTVQSDIKLIDFGFSKEFDTPGKMFHQFVGTCYYMAPEVFKRNYGMEADIWSIAVVFFMMLTGEVYGLYGADQERCKKHVVKKLAEHGISGGAQSFLLAFFKTKPSDRVTATEALSNEWLLSDTQTPGIRKMSSAVAPDASFETLVNFKKKSALQRSAMLAMSMSMTPSELKALGSSFRDMDTDNDGVITFDEFKAHLEKYDTKTNAKEAFAALDMDNSGSLQYSEFIAASIVVSEDSLGQAVEDAFAKLDLDGSRQLTPDELRGMLPAGLNEKELAKILADADKDKDGLIDLEEFRAAFKAGTALQVDLNVSSAGLPAQRPVELQMATTVRTRTTKRIVRMTSVV